MNINSFLFGACMLAFAASGLFFLKYYKASGDRFFQLFSWACGFLAVERIVLCFLTSPFASTPTPQSKSESWVYFFRLIAFLLIARGSLLETEHWLDCARTRGLISQSYDERIADIARPRHEPAAIRGLPWMLRNARREQRPQRFDRGRDFAGGRCGARG